MPRVYVVFPATAWEQALMAACLWGGDETWVSHRAAAALWTLDGFGRGPLEILLPRSGKPRLRGLVTHATSGMIDADKTHIGPIPVTSVTRTLLDIGSVAATGVVEEAFDCALRRGLTSIPRLRWRLEALGTRGRKGAAVVARLLDDRGPVRASESALEVRLGRLLRAGGLPPAVRQYEVVAEGKVVARCDYAYPDALLAIEADGYAFHSGKRSWQRDLTRRTALAALGWRVIHVTDEDLRVRRAEVIATVRAALTRNQTTFPL